MSTPRQDPTPKRTDRNAPRQDATAAPRTAGAQRDASTDGESYAQDRFMGEGFAGAPARDSAQAAPRQSDADDPSSEPRGGGFDSQRTYADADYGRDDAHATGDAHAPDDARAAADALPARTQDTSFGGIGQHEPAWRGNVGPMGVEERRYGQYGDGSPDASASGDASGYAGFRESGLGAPPEREVTEAAPPQAPAKLPPMNPPPRKPKKSDRPARRS